MGKRYKNLAISIALFLLLFLVGCSASEDVNGASEGSETNEEDNQNEAENEPNEEVDNLIDLTIQAPMGLSIAAPIYKVLEDNELHNLVNELTHLPWKNPDELRSRISSEQAQISALPTNVAANLYNNGMDIQLINTLVWGILYIVGPEGEELSTEDLAGKTIYVPFKGDMPDLVLQYLLQKNGMEISNEVTIEYTAAPQEVVQLLATGKAEYAVLPEHTASLSLQKAKQEGHNLQISMSLQEEWAKATGMEPRIPQAGMVATGELIKNNPEIIKELQEQLEESVRYLNEESAEAAELLVQYQDGLEAGFIEKVIPSLNLEFVSAQDAREELEFFFSELSTISPELIGGNLPDDDFYYQE